MLYSMLCSVDDSVDKVLCTVTVTRVFQLHPTAEFITRLYEPFRILGGSKIEHLECCTDEVKRYMNEFVLPAYGVRLN